MLTHVRLTGRLADVLYSMDMTGTDFYAYEFKPSVKLLNSPSNGILLAEGRSRETIEAGLLWTGLDLPASGRPHHFQYFRQIISFL